MSMIRKNARALLIAFGIALALPTALHLTAQVASASGYNITTGLGDVVYCNPGDESDCPAGGIKT
jgi:hypothetical protein